jgi:hypothetical protein
LDKYWVYSYCSNWNRAGWIVFSHSQYQANFVFSFFLGQYHFCVKTLDFSNCQFFPD